jgi:hypothetical protein
MSDLFSRTAMSHEGSFPSDKTNITLGGNTAVQLGIVQNASFQYSQSVNRIYSLTKGANGTSVPVYYVGGRAQGTLTVARILGPASTALSGFYNKMGDVCNPQDLDITFSDGSCVKSPKEGETAPPSAPIKYKLQDCILVATGVSVGAQDMIINENMQFMFASASTA